MILDGVIKMKIWKPIFVVAIFISLYLACAAESEEGGMDEGLAVPICKHINASETYSLSFSVGLNISSASFILSWDNNSSDMEMVLISPSERKIDSSSEQPINYQKNDSMIFYIVPDPEPGNWTAEVIAPAALQMGEDYCAFFIQEADKADIYDGLSNLSGEVMNPAE
jgi:hypothetical protein